MPLDIYVVTYIKKHTYQKKDNFMQLKSGIDIEVGYIYNVK